ncbi:tetratricopeptide repeat protein, partial [Achromobacter sp. GbtcB20]|uniref:tetratricopeptide repeat protein n=1 Tax=Achromobacter sp. GbtcB20 TaxID=2824765 RepID=UPI001C301CE5
ALQGDCAAQFNLGLMYKRGQGVDASGKQALYWFRQAAAAGDRGAQRQPGLAYAEGLGGKPDPRRALAWLQRAAGHGDREAQFILGTVYANGRAGLQVDRDDASAFEWYSRAASQGHVAAQY